MNGLGVCAEIRPELGVYVLGGISPAERALVDRHLASCLRCREEVASLAGLPALLRRVPVAEVVGLAPGEADHPAPEARLSALFGRVAGVRRRRRWLLAAAAAVLIGGTAAAWVPRVLAPPARPRATVVPQWAATAEGVSLRTRAGAIVRYSARPWGTELEVHVTGIPAGTACRFWVTSSDGQDMAAGGWIITAGQRQAWYPASVSFPVASLRGFRVTTGRSVLVDVPVR